MNIAENTDGKLISLTVDGLIAPEDMSARFNKLADRVERQRARFGVARVLVDLRRAPVQPQTTAAKIQAGTGTIYRSTDKLALVVPDGLLKLQSRRTAGAARTAIFPTIVAAEEWLLAD